MSGIFRELEVRFSILPLLASIPTEIRFFGKLERVDTKLTSFMLT